MDNWPKVHAGGDLRRFRLDTGSRWRLQDSAQFSVNTLIAWVFLGPPVAIVTVLAEVFGEVSCVLPIANWKKEYLGVFFSYRCFSLSRTYKFRIVNLAQE